MVYLYLLLPIDDSRFTGPTVRNNFLLRAYVHNVFL